MKITVVGRTDAVISLNKLGAYIHGREKAVLNIVNEEQQREVNGLISAGLIVELVEKLVEKTIMPQPVIQPVIMPVEETAKKRGRPKKEPVKEIIKEAKDQIRVNKAEATTQQMGSRVIITTADGQPVETKMRHSAVNDIVESEKTAASIKAMEKLEKEEKEDNERVALEESSFSPADQMGRKALISTESGEEKVDLVNSVLPEANKIKEADPFIDKDTLSPISPLIDLSSRGKDDDFDDAFIKI